MELHSFDYGLRSAYILGAYFEEKSNRWRAELSYQGKTIHLGKYAEKLEAIKARLYAEKKYHGKGKGETEK